MPKTEEPHNGEAVGAGQLWSGDEHAVGVGCPLWRSAPMVVVALTVVNDASGHRAGVATTTTTTTTSAATTTTSTTTVCAM